MITPSPEYERFLANIADSTPSIMKMRVPSQEEIYSIDLNTRKITPPPFIGVETDHQAEYIFFEMDRFYDLIDLSESIGLIIFKNAKDEEYCQLIPYYDIWSKEGKIIFPWVIQAPAALYTGQVSFSMKFFKIEPTSKKLIYELNTIVAKTKVLAGWANTTNQQSYQTYTLSPESIIIDSDVINGLNTIINAKQYASIYWIDVEPSTPNENQEIDNTTFDNDDILTITDSDDGRDINYDGI